MLVNIETERPQEIHTFPAPNRSGILRVKEPAREDGRAMKTRDIKRRIQTMPEIPPIPYYVHLLLAPAAAGEPPLAEIARLIGADAALASALLAAAEQASGTPPRDLEEALHRLGPAQTAEAVLQDFAPRLFPVKSDGRLDRALFWRHAFACATHAKEIATRVESPHTTLAFAAGLFHDIGAAALDAVAGEACAKARASARVEGRFLLEAERQELGVDHTLAGKWLAERWDLPEDLVAAIWLHHHPAGALDGTAYPVELIDIVALANMLAHKDLDGSVVTVSYPASPEERMARLGLESVPIDELLEAGRPAPPAAAPAPRRLGASPDETVDHAELERLRGQVLRYRGLLELMADKAATDSATLVERLARMLRDRFGIAEGLCYVQGALPHMDGLRWSAERDRLERFDTEAPHVAPSDWTASLGLAAGGVPKPGLVATPLMGRAGAIGQIIFDSTQGKLRPGSPEFAEFLDFTRAFGELLDRHAAAERVREQSEGLAEALWRRDLDQRQALKAERLASVGRMAAGASHEINNPLAIISGRAQIMLSRTKQPEDVKALETIVQQSRRASKILTDLMQFARPSQPKLETVSASFVLHQVAAMMRDRLEAKGIDLAESYTQGVSPVAMDRHQMEQAFLNLILNAEQAMSQGGGTLTLAAKAGPKRKSVILQVTDTGHGIPAGLASQVFEPFFSTRRGPANTGLGLAVCHGIVENHRGTITVNSNPGEGATFTIHLPAAQGQPQEQPQQTSAPAAMPPRHTVLVVSGDRDLRAVLTATLESRGYAARNVETATEALGALARAPVDLVLLDMQVPSEKGTPLIRGIRQRNDALPIIAFTNRARAGEAETAIQLGAQACLYKPFAIERLLAEIAQALGLRHVA